MFALRRNSIWRRSVCIRAVVVGVFGSVMMGSVACKGILEADNLDSVTGEKIGSAAVIPALIEGVAQDFAGSFDLAIATDMSVVTDELSGTGNWPNYQFADKGTFILTETNINVGSVPDGVWNSFQATRALGERAYNSIAELGPVTNSVYAARARLYSGTSYLFLGEVMCDVAFDMGAAQPPVEALKIAETQLTEAITIADAANQPTISQMAHLMRARTRRDLGNSAGALADAQAISNTFIWRVNPVVAGAQTFLHNHVNTFITATTAKGFSATGDPRVPVTVQAVSGLITVHGVGFAYIPTKYPLRDTPLIVGKWQEARLIEAEIRLAAGNTAAALALINQVRAAANLAPTTASTPADVLTALKQERRYEMFLEGTRFADMQRYGETPVEYTGATPFSKVCIPIPITERDNNPNLGSGLHETRP